MLNSWCGQGRLTRDVELRYTASNIPVASFTIACDRDFKSNDGERETDWIDVVAWNKSAEFVEKYFKKGDMIVISGRLQTRVYEDKNGNKRKAVEVIAASLNFCGSKRQDTGAQSGNYAGGQLSQQNYAGGQLSQQNYAGGQLSQQNYMGGQLSQQNPQFGQNAGYGGQYGGQQQAQNSGMGNPYNGGNQNSPDPLDGFMNIPDALDEELPFH